MPALPAQQGLMPSILDRLTDPESAGTEARQGFSVKQLVDAVCRDLENLLNTRQTFNAHGKVSERMQNSILGYGLPEMTFAQGNAAREKIAGILGDTIALYEPRLHSIRVVVEGDADPRQSALRFRIEARLAVEPAPHVIFDSTMQLSTGQHTVRLIDE